MRPFTITRQSYLLEGKPTYLVSGEFHYFRVPQQDWRRRMQLFKEAGGNCLATYIPWLLHEPEEGRFCFAETHEWLDLEGFLQTAQDMDLYVLARPGPYQYSELVYDGLPAWLCEDYPQLLARNFKGQVFRQSSVSYLHPLFLQKVERWFDVICPILARYTLQNGGPIAWVQFDNELAGIHEWFGSLDYNPESMEFGQSSGRFARFLTSRYTDIGQLNAAYNTRYLAFRAVKPPDPALERDAHDIRRKKDYFDFYLSTLAEYACRLAGMIRKHGIDTPLVHNSANPEMNAYFLEIAQALGESFLLGSDHYYNLGQNWKQNNPTPQYAARVFYSLEMLRLMGYPPTVMELPGGSAADWPPVTAEDALACYLTNLALGMKGSNYYIFTGGPNPPGAGATTDLYDYSASISARGEIRPLYQSQQAFGSFLHTHSWLAGGERLGDVRLALDFEYARSEKYWQQRGDKLLSSPQAWEFWRSGPLTTAFCAGLSPVVCNLDSDDWLADLSTPLLVVCSSSMSASKQERLVRFLRGGGKALFMPVLPDCDENLQPCSLLADFLGNVEIQINPKPVARPLVAGVVNVSGSVYFYKNIPEDAQVVGRDELSGQVVAWSRAYPGGGKALVLGLQWVHGMREHERMLKALLEQLGLHQQVRCSNPNVWTSLWRAGSRSGLFILNLLSAHLQAQINVQVQKDSPVIDTGLHSLDPISVKWVEL